MSQDPHWVTTRLLPSFLSFSPSFFSCTVWNSLICSLECSTACIRLIFYSQCELRVTICVLLCWPATTRASVLLHQNGCLLFNKQKTSHFPARFFFCLAFDLWCRALTGLKAECCVAIKVKLRVLELCSFPLFSSFLKQLVYPGFQVHSQWKSCFLLHWIVALLLLNLQEEAFKKFLLSLPVKRGIGTADS